MTKRIGNEERIFADGDEFIVGEVFAVTVIKDVLHGEDIDLFVENERLRCGWVFAPSIERIVLVIPGTDLIEIFERDFDAPAVAVMQQPGPELWDAVDDIIEVFGIDDGIGVDKIQHSACPFPV